MNERIRELRKALNLTLEKFGQRLGVGKTAISKLEKGENNVTDQMFKAICREFNVSEDWLRYGTGEIFVIPKNETAALVSNLLEEPNNEFYQLVLEIMSAYEQLKPESQDVLREFGKQLLENKKDRKA